jgi:hypothetical protein
MAGAPAAKLIQNKPELINPKNDQPVETQGEK